MLSATVLVGTTLEITGNATDEVLALRISAADANLLLIDDGNDGTADHTMDRSTFDRIKLDGAGSNDLLVIDETNGVFADTELTTLVGGEGNDTLMGGSRGETFWGGAGDDHLMGGDDIDSLGGHTIDDLVGGPGNDTIDGGPGADHANYADSPGAVTLNLTTGIGLDGFGGTDTLLNVEALVGSNFDDLLMGGSGFTSFIPLAGNDTVNGGADTDALDYSTSPAAVDVNFATGMAMDGQGGMDTILNVELVFGSAFDDVLTGGNPANDAGESFDGGGGNDTINGGSGYDYLEFQFHPSGVSVNLATGVVHDGFGGTDTISNVEAVGGSFFNDLLVGGNPGSDSIESFEGRAGGDTIDGGTGFDQITHYSAPAAIVVNLMTGMIQDGFGNTDTVNNIDYVVGSSFDDLLTGGNPANDGFEAFDGRAGNDTVDGGTGSDQLDFGSAPSGVVVNLVTGTAQDGWGTVDTFVSIDRVAGSFFDDMLVGGNLANPKFELFDGRAGNDTIDGGGGFDQIFYQFVPGAIVVNLATGIVQDGYGTTDMVASVEGVIGSNFDDLLIGGNPASDGFEAFGGNGGNDTIDGGSGSDQVDYFADPAGVIVNLATGTASDGFGGTDTIRNVERVAGSFHDDMITGSDQPSDVIELFEARGGNDTINGAGGFDQYYAEFAPAAVTVNLATGVAQDGYGGTDTVSSIERVIGSAFDDMLIGGNPASDSLEVFVGLAGNDTIDGGTGGDNISFDNSPAGVVVNLATGMAQDGFGGVDTLLNIEFVTGSFFADQLIGGNAASTGLESFDGLGGNDTIDGGSGNDAVDFSFGPGAVQVDLAAGTAQDGRGGADTLISIETVLGSRFDDLLIGDAGSNDVRGGPGNDTIRGGAGQDNIDQFESGQGNELLEGGEGDDAIFLQGTDAVDGGAGYDILNCISDSQGGFAVVAVGANVTVVGPASRTAVPAGAVSVEEVNLRATDLFNPSNIYLVGDLSGTTVELVSISAFRVPGAVAAAAFAGTLTIAGRTVSDNISVSDVDLGYFGPNPTVTLGWGRVGFGFLAGSGGTVMIDARDGDDTVQVNSTATLGGIRFNLKGGVGNDGLTAGPGDDVLDGGLGNDALHGGPGNDALIGGEGNDILDGDGGDGDTADFSAATKKVVLNLAAAVPSAKGQGKDSVIGVENVIGSPLGDTLIGNALANRIEGRGGNDKLTGGVGDDALLGGLGNDQIRGGPGDDTLTGTEGVDRLFGDADFDELFVDLFDKVKQGERWSFLSDTTWRAIGPLGNLAGNPINSVGAPWEVTHPGWNSDLAFDDSAAAGWSNAIFNDGAPGNIWVNGNGDGGSTPAYFRLEFDIPASLAATLEGGVDDDAQIYINGVLVFDDHDGGAADFAPIDVTSFLHAGRNLITVKAHDSFGLHEALRVLLRVTSM